MKRILVTLGTRPEVIKMAPIVFALRKVEGFEVITCATAQHRELLDQVLDFFRIKPDFDLNLMKANQDLGELTSRCLIEMEKVLRSTSPCLTLVQGDTTSALAAALSSYYRKVPVGHVEAGLRTYDKYSPYPEEMNRRMISCLSDYHFAPTPLSREQLHRENTPRSSVYMVGNTVVDALLWALKHCSPNPHLASLIGEKKVILLTLHRRESFGAPLQGVMAAVRRFVEARKDCHVIYPVHPNPNVKAMAQQELGSTENVSLVPPLPYGELCWLMQKSIFMVTDSGGIQEEAPTLGKPILVVREKTERPEAVEAGCAQLVGYDPETIVSKMNELADPKSKLFRSMSTAKSPYGDGTSAEKISEILATAILGSQRNAA